MAALSYEPQPSGPLGAPLTGMLIHLPLGSEGRRGSGDPDRVACNTEGRIVQKWGPSPRLLPLKADGIGRSALVGGPLPLTNPQSSQPASVEGMGRSKACLPQSVLSRPKPLL